MCNIVLHYIIHSYIYSKIPCWEIDQAFGRYIGRLIPYQEFQFPQDTFLRKNQPRFSMKSKHFAVACCDNNGWLFQCWPWAMALMAICEPVAHIGIVSSSLFYNVFWISLHQHSVKYFLFCMFWKNLLILGSHWGYDNDVKAQDYLFGRPLCKLGERFNFEMYLFRKWKWEEAL